MLATLPRVPLMSEEEAQPTVTVRVDTELVRMARIICAHTPGRAGKNLKLVDFLDGLLRGPIQTRYKEVLAKLVEDQAGEAKETRQRKKT